MKHLTTYHLFEGVTKQDDGFRFDFSGDKEGDIMSLKFPNKRMVKRTTDGVPYSYYFAYEFDSVQDKDLLKAIKSLDNSIDTDSIEMLVNKAVIGLDNAVKLNTFDTIVYPTSSSVILKEMGDKAHTKSGNTVLIPDAFVKAARTEINFDFEKINKLPESTKKQVLKMVDAVKSSDGEFKLKEIYARYRKFINDFIIFNSEDDRKVHNAIVGKKILLIDDYRTTGTTLKEMRNKLIELQPSEIVMFLMIKVI